MLYAGQITCNKTNNSLSVFSTGLAEAQDIIIHLSPLQGFIDELEQTDFADLPKYLQPIMHVICLIWSNSEYYNTPPRIIVLLQEICNHIIEMVSDLSKYQTVFYHAYNMSDVE